MAPEIWPTDVTQCLVIGSYAEEWQPVAIRSPVDNGPAKLRRRYTKPIVAIIGTITCTKKELASLKFFFDVVLQGGVLQFNFPSPTTDKIEVMRFMQPPRLVALTDSHLTVELVMEIL